MDRLIRTTGNTFRQVEAMNKTRIAEEKSKIFRAAFILLANTLRPKFGSTEIDLASENLVEVQPSTYTGDVCANVAIYTDAGLKRVSINASVKDSKVYLKEDKEAVLNRIEAQLKDVEGSIDAYMKEVSANIDSKIKAIDDKISMDEEVSTRIEAGEDVKQAYASVYNGIRKQAKEYTAPDIDGGKQNVLGEIPSILHINKVSYPSNLEVGDVLNLGGNIYKIKSSSVGLSGTEDGAQWVCELQH